MIVFLTALSLAAASDAMAQKSTEVYIPLGQSPGASGVSTVRGRVERISDVDSTIALQLEGRRMFFKVAANTAIYLDKSKIGLTNTEGIFADIKPGLMIEAKFPDNDKDGFAEWVKVQFE